MKIILKIYYWRVMDSKKKYFPENFIIYPNLFKLHFSI